MTHRGGRIYHSNCACTTERKHVTVKISDDDFQSCREISVSEIGGYSDLALLGDKICVFYEKRYDDKPYELYFDVIEE